MPSSLRNHHTPNRTTAPIDAIEENLYAMLAAWGRIPGSELVQEPPAMRYTTGIAFPAFNGVARARLAQADVEHEIDALLAFFRQHALPSLWWLGPSATPATLGERLVARGLVRTEDAIGMALSIDQISAPALVPGLEIRRVSGATEMARWTEIVASCFDLPHDILPACTRLFAAMGDGRASRAYMGLLDGTPVGVSSLYGEGDVAGIHWVGTLAAARGRGIGTAMTWAVVDQARALGYRMAVLHASQMGLGVYRRLGFTPHCTFEHYVCWR